MRDNDSGYYDLPIDFESILVENGMVEELFYLKELRQRKLFLNTDIDHFSVIDIVKNILQYNREDIGLEIRQRVPVVLYITSNGGDIDSGFELIDVILNSKTPVYTVNLGYQYSMGFLVGLAGHKRFATPNAKFLMHDGSNLVFGSSTKVHDQIEFQRRVEKRIKDYIISRSNLTSEEYDSKLRMEWYLFADEAKEKGFTDYIIGVDCDIDDIQTLINT